MKKRKRIHYTSEQKACSGHTEFGHLNRGDMLTSEQYRYPNEKKKFQCRVQTRISSVGC